MYVQGLLRSRVPQSMSCRVHCSHWMCLKAMLLLLPLPVVVPTVCRCSPVWEDTAIKKEQS